ncbi:MAG TPA: CCA tRNA nucleotidyltransferase [Dehalococcoidia bacterium]|nr:CCA tRNA nucleotidyltransferase [Dehalococcoidia bacterium]
MSQDFLTQLEKHLPQPIRKLITDAGKKACEMGMELYLVGGTVRDLFLGSTNFDLDLVVEGDAIELANELAKDSQAKLTIHPRFGTAKLSFTDFSLDLATARSETYSKPGALPTVRPGTLKDDLFRRDFTINAMAVCLVPQRFGELIDLYRGKDDLEHRLIRILHPNSFTDDATRILRALRYEQRLGFKLEPETESSLRQNIAMLDTISGDRIRHELELISKEKEPERVLRRADELGVLNRLHPSLRGNGWLGEMFSKARQFAQRVSLSVLYLCLFVYRLTKQENDEFISRLNFPKASAQAMCHTLKLKAQLPVLTTPGLKPSDIHQLLRGYAPPAIQTNALATESPVASQRLHFYLSRLRYMRPALNGEDLQRMGIPAGPQIREVLQILHRARLNGEAQTRQDEERLVRIWRQTTSGTKVDTE